MTISLWKKRCIYTLTHAIMRTNEHPFAVCNFKTTIYLTIMRLAKKPPRAQPPHHYYKTKIWDPIKPAKSIQRRRAIGVTISQKRKVEASGLTRFRPKVGWTIYINLTFVNRAQDFPSIPYRYTLPDLRNRVSKKIMSTMAFIRLYEDSDFDACAHIVRSPYSTPWQYR